MNEMKSYSQAVTGVSFFKDPFGHLGIVLFLFVLNLACISTALSTQVFRRKLRFVAICQR